MAPTDAPSLIAGHGFRTTGERIVLREAAQAAVAFATSAAMARATAVNGLA